MPPAIRPSRLILLLGVALLSSCDSNPIGPEFGPPASLSVVSGNGQSAAFSSELPNPLTIKVQDANSRTVPGVTIHWEITSGGGSVEPASSLTDDLGLAQTRWTLGQTLGDQTLNVVVQGVIPLQFKAVSRSGTPAIIEKVAGDNQIATVATQLPILPTIAFRDAAGNPCADRWVQIRVTSGGGWVPYTAQLTDGNGEISVNWYMGPQAGATNVLDVSYGAMHAEFTAGASSLVPGETLFGRNDYMEFIVGDLPLVVSAPHGGYLTPVEIPDRTYGTTGRDRNVQELARSIGDAFAELYGGSRPHIIICRLARVKLDANREIVEAAQGSRFSEWAWNEWHLFIEAAKSAAAEVNNWGFYIDLHGHGHAIDRLELGYLLSSSNLELTDESLNNPTYINKSSIRNLANTSPLTFAELIRGQNSLGTLFENAGVPAVPSTPQPRLSGESFFSGGPNTARHGSRDGGVIDGVQIEANYPGIRDTAINRYNFALNLALVMDQYFTVHYGYPLTMFSPWTIPAYGPVFELRLPN